MRQRMCRIRSSEQEYIGHGESRGTEANFRAKRVERAAGRQGKAKGSIKRAEKPGVVQSKQNVVVVVSASYTPPSML